MTAVPIAATTPPLGAGAAGRLQSYLLLLKWQLLAQRKLLPLFVTIQIALGVGIIFGFAFLLPSVSPSVAIYFSTGAATTLTLLLVGLVLLRCQKFEHCDKFQAAVPRRAPVT